MQKIELTDSFRRRTGMTDLSSGTTAFSYDPSGNLLTETNAKGEVIQ